MNNKKYNKLNTIKVIRNYNRNHFEVPDNYFEKRKHFVSDMTHFSMDMTSLKRVAEQPFRQRLGMFCYR